MLKQLLIFIFIISNITAHSQRKPFTVELEETFKTNTIEFYFSEVIDKRLVKENIGFTYKALSNQPISAIFPETFEKYFGDYIKAIFEHRKGSPLVLIVHEFNLSESVTRMSSKGKFSYQFELARRDGEDLYAIWYSEGEVDVRGLDYINSQSSRIVTGLKDFVREFKNSDWKNQEGTLILLDKELHLNINEPKKFGLYSSFARLVRNEPFMEKGFEVKKIGDKYPKYHLENSTGNKISQRTAFMASKNAIYLHASRYSYGSYFIKSKLIGKYIYFEDRFSNPTASLMFGLSGSLVSYEAKGIVLDTESGLVYTLDDTGTKKFLEKYPEILRTYMTTPKKLENRINAIKTINKIYEEKK